MAGILVVSHSFHLGVEVIKVATELSPKIKFPLVNASGMKDTSLGTDPDRILSGIREANRGKGVIILCDLGNSVLDSLKAISLLDPHEKKQVFIADAPLVEGAIIAATANCSCNTLSCILNEIEESKTFPKFRRKDD